VQPTPPANADLEALLRVARQGRQDALGDLLQAYRPYLLRIADGEFPAALRAKAGGSDVVQDTLVEALACFAQFRGQSLGELQGWLRTILLRQVGQVTRGYQATGKRQIDREVPLPELGDSAEVLAAQQSTASAKFVRQEEADAVREALGRLPEHYRQVLVWREWEGRPLEEIAQRLNRSVDAARMLWWRAIERFNEEMGQRG
jgi:RNA polymerase sigma-70 factor (ECF subfamily)